MKTKILLLAIIACVGFSFGSFAQTGKFAAKHPRRAEVNHRLNHQDNRINHEVKDGQISRHKSTELHQRDRNIRATERADASKNGGHISKAEKNRLNARENNVSKSIRK